MDIEKRIKEIEAELKTTKYNKSTEKHILKLKARITFLRKELDEKRKAEKKRISREGIRKQGVARVSIIGPPSVGKSNLFNLLTNAKSEVGDYAFTTLKVHPGILKYRGAEIQMLDMPGLIEGAAHGRGNGREILSVARDSDLLLILLDVNNLNIKAILKELHDFGIRVNQKKPNINIKKTDKGGLHIASTISLSESEETIRIILYEFGFRNADILIKEDVSATQLMDFLAGNKAYIPAILAINKIDTVTEERKTEVINKLKLWNPVFISVEDGYGIDRLKELIFDRLELLRVYLKPQSGKVDYHAPLILRRGDTIMDVCKSIHKEFVKNFRYAMVWGRSVKFPGQRVGADHRVDDEDIVRLVIRKYS